MLRHWWGHFWHALPSRRRLDAELHLSALQRDLSRERLRQVQSRLDALQAAVDVRTSRRQAEERDRR